VRLLATKWFVRYARRERLDAQSLRNAIARAERGLVDADLGGGIIKHRVARTGEGRSGGFRLLKKERLEHAINEGLLKEVSYEDKKR
jgi:hypothetical protein